MHSYGLLNASFQPAEQMYPSFFLARRLLLQQLFSLPQGGTAIAIRVVSLEGIVAVRHLRQSQLDSLRVLFSSAAPEYEAEMASMQKLIVEGMKAGWLIEFEGVSFGATGVRVHKAPDGKVSVTDGPFAETKEVLGGYALLNAASKEEAVKHTRRFLDHICQETSDGSWEGTWETYQLFEMPAVEGQ